MLYRLLVASLTAAVLFTGILAALEVSARTPHVFYDDIRGAGFPITTIIETPEAIHDEAVSRGLTTEDSDIVVMGIAAYNVGLTICTIWVPPLTAETLWIWVHEVRHCNTGAFHAN